MLWFCSTDLSPALPKIPATPLFTVSKSSRKNLQFANPQIKIQENVAIEAVSFRRMQPLSIPRVAMPRGIIEGAAAHTTRIQFTWLIVAASTVLLLLNKRTNVILIQVHTATADLST